jgi:hypothetical protein
MNLREKILLVSDIYCAANGRGRKRVSTLALSRGSKLDDIASGADLTTRSYEAAMLWFSNNWPDGVEWPAAVHRPAPEKLEAAE